MGGDMRPSTISIMQDLQACYHFLLQSWNCVQTSYHAIASRARGCAVLRIAQPIETTLLQIHESNS